MSVIRDTTSGAPGRGASAEFFFADFEFFVGIFLKFFVNFVFFVESLRKILMKNSKKISMKNLTQISTKINPVLAPSTWRARCRVSEHGHQE